MTKLFSKMFVKRSAEENFGTVGARGNLKNQALE